MQAFIDKLLNSRFAGLKGSSADLHLVLTQEFLNEAANALTSDQGPSAIAWLDPVKSINVNGSLTVDIKLKVSESTATPSSPQ